MSEILLPLHLIILSFIAVTVVSASYLGFNWIRGKIKILDEKQVQKYHKRVWIGLCMMILSGFSLFWPLREFLLERQEFYVKMTFIGILIMHGLTIGKLQKVAQTRTFTSLTVKEKVPIFISGAVSTIAWLGAIFGGLYLIPGY